jgi:hypothetical protein
MACAIAGITESTPPWNLTGFQKEKNPAKRQADIAKFLITSCGNALKNSDVQQDMALRREYLETRRERSVEDETLAESIPSGFAPEQKSGVGAEVAPIVAEAASPKERSRAWILLGNQIVKENSTVSTSPYIETACCYRPIQTPASFWDEKASSLPDFPRSKTQHGQRGSHLAVHYNTRRQERLNVIAPDDILYRVFLQVCFKGARLGLPHEPGYDFVCPHCEFQFPRSSDIITPEEGRRALEDQKIDTSRKEFQHLLDESHERYTVPPVKTFSMATGMDLLEKMRRLDPPPFHDWRKHLAETILRVQTLPQEKTPDEMDIATVYGELSNMMEEFKQSLRERVGDETARIVERLVSQTPADIVESLQTYFLIPFQRLRTGFSIKSLKVQKSYKLGEGTEQDLEGLLNTHLSYLDALKRNYHGLTRAKIDSVRKKLAVALPVIQKEIRTPLIPGGSIGLPYLLGALVLGIISECADPNLVPQDETIEQNDDESENPTGTMEMIRICVGRFKAEGLKYTDEEIRTMIARREEVEKMRIIKKLDRMTPEEKKAELMMKRLGLGDWAVGGTKAVYAYDPKQYERERGERAEMVGILEGVVAPDEADGYDNAQTREDDY